MTQQTLQILCPDCKTPIYIDTRELLIGKSFTCTGCDVNVSLEAENVKAARNTMEEFKKLEELKKSK